MSSEGKPVREGHNRLRLMESILELLEAGGTCLEEGRYVNYEKCYNTERRCTNIM